MSEKDSIIKKFISDLDLFGGKRAARGRVHDQDLFSEFSEIFSSDEITNICDSLMGSAEYYASQINDLQETLNFIEDDDNAFINGGIQSLFEELQESIESLVDFIPGISLPHCRQDEEDDYLYTFNYQRWDRDVNDYEREGREFNENMATVIGMCKEMKESYKKFREAVRDTLAI
ncbi:MAG TPA: hypothetical protein PKB11_09625 [Desulfovibrio sp.]|uniref:hypothetical protein n=1 Tax=Desulfovibrio sp. TaxID=885 RepID=UPI002BA7BBC9|nr:hypothetical protein [Desulfovibrio sp.]HMM39001.1 hypothetical protein [Desulfovibrio sp.]